MNANQRQRAKSLLNEYRPGDDAPHVYHMAALLQELVDADEKFKSNVVAAINGASPDARHVEVDGQPVFFRREGDDITDTHTLSPCPHCGGSGAAADCAPAPSVPDVAQTIPSHDQITQLLNGLDRCGVAKSKRAFLRTWIRDWTAHKLSAAPTPAEAPADVARDAERWRMLPAFLEEFEISYLRLEDAIDASIAAEKGGAK